MVEPVSAIVGLVAIGCQISIKARSYVAQFKKCPEEVALIAAELEEINLLIPPLETLVHECNDSHKGSYLVMATALKNVFGQLEEHIKHFGFTAKKRHKLKNFKKSRSWGKEGMAEAKYLRKRLANHRSILGVLLQIDNK